jgi:hypothetical protein
LLIALLFDLALLAIVLALDFLLLQSFGSLADLAVSSRSPKLLSDQGPFRTFLLNHFSQQGILFIAPRAHFELFLQYVRVPLVALDIGKLKVEQVSADFGPSSSLEDTIADEELDIVHWILPDIPLLFMRVYLVEMVPALERCALWQVVGNLTPALVPVTLKRLN